MSEKKPKAHTRPARAGKDGAAAQHLQFDFVESNDFRVIHVDGAWGGFRSDLTLHMSLYSERPATPKTVRLELDPESLTAEEIVEEQRNLSIRELEVCALMDLRTAKALRDWLNEKVRTAEDRLAELMSRQGEEGD